MPGTVIEVNDDGTPYLTVWRADDPDWPFKFGADLAAARYFPEPGAGHTTITYVAAAEAPPEVGRASPPAGPPSREPARMPLGQRLRLLVAECDYRGEQLTGSAVSGCGCTATWHCAQGKGLPMTPFEVPLGTCFACVQGKETP